MMMYAEADVRMGEGDADKWGEGRLKITNFLGSPLWTAPIGCVCYFVVS